MSSITRPSSPIFRVLPPQRLAHATALVAPRRTCFDVVPRNLFRPGRTRRCVRVTARRRLIFGRRRPAAPVARVEAPGAVELEIEVATVRRAQRGSAEIGRPVVVEIVGAVSYFFLLLLLF